ncbi:MULTISPECIES: DUF2242 domain-containing protein [Pseudomonas]|jgi:hypothetical protein|uniref:DUF2242 domain-containing protein n=1 Tax=Pseudomonas fluorescens TaxID=294 RepID=A0A5E7I2Q1_PSEFL|nr:MULTISPECIES: DUF2242 domain-containing protein [Pseudomonas]KPG97778.1 hypothetical protein AK821_08360 [Pseudomonas sp. RIT-PI-r]PRB49935.1 DUF2242 domain-containing protein [Pseudomonas sp. MYb3]PRC36573.1 DUF2242 domain-containing protein [Pseudomonas sp. MYb2]VVO71001.1 hypothetical protein PS896_01328 [Pseudomonas fluorescens]
MLISTPMRVFGLALLLTAVAGCSKDKPMYEHENFDDSGTFSRNYPVTDAVSCEAARRALLSQGYIITSSDPKIVSGHKSFQQTGDTHMEISFNVVCADDGTAGHHATMFANALQDRYALKKTNNSASLGVGVLGSVSMPIGSSDDSMVKVASETVTAQKFYERFFTLVEQFMPAEAKKAAHIEEKPKADLGMPEPKPAPAALTPTPAATPAPAAEPAPAPAEAAPVSSEPVVPPTESAPITPAPTAEPAPATETITPPANPDIPPPTEPIPAMPASGQ